MYYVCRISAAGWPEIIERFDSYSEAELALDAFGEQLPNAWLEVFNKTQLPSVLFD
jgi:hypothetical protein